MRVKQNYLESTEAALAQIGQRLWTKFGEWCHQNCVALFREMHSLRLADRTENRLVCWSVGVTFCYVLLICLFFLTSRPPAAAAACRCCFRCLL